MEGEKMNAEDITDFDIDDWLDDSDDTPSTPNWLRPGKETEYYDAFAALVETCKSNILEADSPSGLAFIDYQVSVADVCKSLGKSRSALREDRMPNIFKHMEDTNAMLCALKKREGRKKHQAQGYKNKPELLSENNALKSEVKKLKEALRLKFMDMLIEGSDSASIQDKVQKITDLEARNKELERQVARMTQQLRSNFKAIE
jgi:hypothetical protein